MTPEQEIMRPECDTERWWELAAEHPIEAIQSDLYPLLTLENPERWEALEQTNGREWADALVLDRMGVHQFSEQSKRLLAVDTATRVLPNWKKKYPKDNRPAKAIAQATLFAFGLITEEDLDKARAAAYYAALPSDVDAAGYAARAASAAAASGEHKEHTKASSAAASTTYYANVSADLSRNDKGFSLWVWRRALEFLFATNQLPPPWNAYAASLNTKKRSKNAKIGGVEEEAQVRAIASSEPIRAIMSPHCPVDLWWELAGRYPIDAMQSDLYPLLTLESPDRWTEMEYRRATSWYDSLIGHFPHPMPPYTARLTSHALRLLAIECVRYVLHFLILPRMPKYEHYLRADVLAALNVTERWLFALATKEELQAQHALFAKTSDEPKHDPCPARMREAIMAITNARRPSPVIAYRCAELMSYVATESAKDSSAGKDFYHWAWRRALDFLAATPGLPSPWDQYETKGPR